ncbi:MAG: hypothetical protein CVV25_12115 [Ignavibacteriae bacterium HGW-Ignavibacteriae-4]|jgi:hypothetical protein|nr:MAG: hypothetical protein CVV25_12115 [Ignavibacteriae bacterium HGW-Ignavibacteriae-4]
MLVDSLARIDTVFNKINTVYIENSSGFLTEKDVLRILDTAQSSYNIYITIFLTLLTIGIALFGYIIPKKNKEELEKIKQDIKNDNERNESRLNREIDHIRNENRRFQESIDDRIVIALKNKSEEIENKLTKTLSPKMDKIYRNTLILFNINSAAISFMNNAYDRALDSYLAALVYCIDYNYYDYIKDINEYLKKLEGKPFQHDISWLESKLNMTFDEFKSNSLIISKDSIQLYNSLINIFKTLDKILKNNNDK